MARPETESRADSFAQDLANLQWEVDINSTHVGTGAESMIFTQNDLSKIQSLLNILTEKEHHVIADKIVASLNYDSRPVRHDSVPQAHKDTFRWAFDSRLADWFRTGSSTFWVSGKPGSGKSTFMKFISTHQQTKELLSSWAGSVDKLAVAAHFFWIAGTPIQKSWQGLFQSLLFDTFHKHPAVIQLISPERWRAAKKGEWQTASGPWSVAELGVALRALASAPNFPLKLCFFIDGLDEYDSDHSELCNILYDMAQAQHIKMCLSSRPWPVFEEKFGSDSTKRMDIHELTKDDIRRFVDDQLSLPASRTSDITEAARQDICRQIAAGADGVFLWAFFVTKSTREALGNGATAADLRVRLDKLPGDLDQLFTAMLETVDKIDRPKMAGMLQAASHALEPLHFDLYWMIQQQFDNVDYAQSCAIRGATFEELSSRRDQTIYSVNDKTKGLLRLVNHRFEFLHRTVKDFVLTRDMEEYLRRKLPIGYNGYSAIATAYLGYLKRTRFDNSIVASVIRMGQGRNSGAFTSHLNQALLYASEALKSDPSPDTMILLEAYEAAVEEMIRIGHVFIKGNNAESCSPKLLFREEILRHRLTPYVRRRMRDDTTFLDPFDEPPLYAALMRMSLSSGESPSPTTAVLEILLQGGQDPNATVQRTLRGNFPQASRTEPSPWVLYARDSMSVFNMLSGPAMFPAIRFSDSINNGIIELLLSYGANPNASLLPEKPLGARTAFSHFLDISVSQFLGNECFEGYLRTLAAFMRAGANLGIPTTEGIAVSSESPEQADAQEAHGNLARAHPDEPVLTSYCREFELLLPRLTADLERTKFIQSVLTQLIVRCSGNDREIQQLSSAIYKGCPEHIRHELLSLIKQNSEQRGSTKRDRGSWDKEPPNSVIKHLRQ